MSRNSIVLNGVIDSAILEDGVIEFKVNIGQSIPARFNVTLISKNSTVEKAGQSLLSEIALSCRVYKLNDAQQLIGKNLAVRVIQPKVSIGIIQPFVVVSVERSI